MIRIENRYTRQIGCTPGFDQQKIQGATVLIAGVGGLGCSVSMLLAAAGIGGFRKMLNYAEKASPLRRTVTINEVGNVAAFLCSDLASGITGETTFVDAGANIMGMVFDED